MSIFEPVIESGICIIASLVTVVATTTTFAAEFRPEINDVVGDNVLGAAGVLGVIGIIATCPPDSMGLSQ